MYGLSFADLNSGNLVDPTTPKFSTKAIVRRRRWIRRVREVQGELNSVSEVDVGGDGAMSRAAAAAGVDPADDARSEFGDNSSEFGFQQGAGAGGDAGIGEFDMEVASEYGDGGSEYGDSPYSRSGVAPRIGGTATRRGSVTPHRTGSIFGFGNAPAIDPNLVIRDSGLLAINRQIK